MSLIRWLAGFWPRHRRSRYVRRRRPANPWRSRLAVTPLEDRLAPAILTVTSLADALISGTSSALSLREAIALIDSGGTATDSSGNRLATAKASHIETSQPFGVMDTIRFDPQLFGSSQQQIVLKDGQLLLSADVTIVGPGASQLAVNGNNQTRVFEITESAVVSISGLTAEGGALSTSSGAGISNAGTLRLTDVIVSRNSAQIAGGIANTGTLTLTDSGVSDNAAALNDGGILNTGTLTLAHSTVAGNSAQGVNGGLVNYNGKLTLRDSTISGNSALANGGIANYDGTVALVNSTVSGNSAQWAGGIGNYLGAMTLTRSAVYGNSADNWGGIINTGTLRLTDSTVSRNSATGIGGGIVNWGGALALLDSIVSGNRAAISGGIYNHGLFSARNSVLVGNSGGDLAGSAAFQDLGDNLTDVVNYFPAPAQQVISMSDAAMGGSFSHSSANVDQPDAAPPALVDHPSTDPAPELVGRNDTNAAALETLSNLPWQLDDSPVTSDTGLAG
jgi:hypothetical protein